MGAFHQTGDFAGTGVYPRRITTGLSGQLKSLRFFGRDPAGWAIAGDQNIQSGTPPGVLGAGDVYHRTHAQAPVGVPDELLRRGIEVSGADFILTDPSGFNELNAVGVVMTWEAWSA